MGANNILNLAGGALTANNTSLISFIKNKPLKTL